MLRMTPGDRLPKPNETALYVHWPFCVSKCPYCDFNSHVVESVDHGAWRDALLRELAYEADRSDATHVQSVFFGGGTPSLMEADTVRAIITAATSHWTPIADLEISLEANPGTVDAERFTAFKDAGVNRLSLGVQSLDDDHLTFLGRKHTAAEAMTAIALAGQTFERLSFDLIYARPGQTEDEWRAELSRAVEILHDAGGAHLSCYQLTIEDNTPFEKAYARGDFVLPDEDGGVLLFDVTQDVLEAAGLPAYEISNHAASGETCRHNTHVWHGGLYAGIGPGAHGRVSAGGAVRATTRHKPPARWLKAVSESGHGSNSDTIVSPQDRARELVMLGLRLSDGLSLTARDSVTGLSPLEVMSHEALEWLESDGLVVTASESLRTTERGRLVLNSVISSLLDRSPG